MQSPPIHQRIDASKLHRNFSTNSGHSSTRKSGGNSGTIPGASGTTPGPSPHAIRDYLTSMRQRAALLARTGERGTVYLAVHPNIAGQKYWPKTVAAITRDLQPVEVQSLATRWPGKDPGARYVLEWDDYADGLTGLAVIVGKARYVGNGIMREIKSAQVRGLPILVRTPTRQVPLINCTIRPTGDPRPWRAMKIELPAPDREPSDTLTATLAAMGARPVTR